MPNIFAADVGSDFAEISVLTDASYDWYLVGVYGRVGVPIKRWVIYEAWHNMTEDFSIHIDALMPDVYHSISLLYNTEPSVESAKFVGSSFTTLSYEGTYQNSVTILYNTNGGTGAPGPQSFSSESVSLPITISTDIPQKEGYAFLYWALPSIRYGSTDSYSRFYPGEEFPAYGAGREWTLYAVWEKAVNIHNGETFVKAIPHIYYDGSWRQVIPYVHNGTEWISTN